MTNPPLTPLGPGGEFDRIRYIWRRLGKQVSHAGDDCAIVEVGAERLALSSDLSIENVHFKLGWMTPEEIGWRATAAALSDLAAVGATPLGVLVSLAVPGEWPEEQVGDLMQGAGAAAAASGAAVWGGDLTRNESVVIDVAVVGRMEGRPLLRSGATAGDELWVTGLLGGPAAALAAWRDGREPEETARARFVRPEPRVAHARWLRDRGAKAMIDLSDGLAADATHLAAASAVRCTIDAALVPVHPSATSATAALASGEEYELLLALPPARPEGLAGEFGERFHLPLTRIGIVESGDGIAVVSEGKPIQIPEIFKHF